MRKKSDPIALWFFFKILPSVFKNPLNIDINKIQFMKKLLLFLFLVPAFATQLYGQDHVADSTVVEYQKFKINAEIGNLSRSINDGFIKLEVLGGQPPYTYKWSNQATSMKS